MPSAGRPSVLAGGTSSFGQFRLTTFVDSNPKVKASPALQTAPDDTTALPDSLIAEHESAIPLSHAIEPFVESLQESPSGLDDASSTTIAPNAQAGDTGSTAHNGFGVLDLAPEPAARQGKLGPHRDGRVRNPIPRKLKGKTNEKSGNFAVMHMDMSGSGSYDIPRGEAAKRTSENTAEAARNANSAGYVPVKRRRVEPAAQATQKDDIMNGSRFFPNLPQQEPARRNRFLTAEETKYEQARLLTLLRSITPLTVVDQICKALAFFGGIPGAPPPGDGVFPVSAEANGSGALFVGWLSEIFPELARKDWNIEAVKPPDEPVRVKRPRGRPKGSKASKVRKDKGVKKGPKYPGNDDSRGLPPPLAHLRPATSQDETMEGDDEWIDVTGIDGDFNDVNHRTSTLGEQTGREGRTMSGMDGIQQDVNDNRSYVPTANMGKRRPGRPKGSRNRPRETDVRTDPGPSSISSDLVASDIHSLAVFEDNSLVKKKRGRPPLNKSVSQGLLDQSAPPTPTVNQKIAEGPQPTVAPMVGLSAEERAVLEAFRTARAAQTTSAPLEKEKRKRVPKKSTAIVPQASQETPIPGPGLVPETVINPIVSSPPVAAPVQAESTPQSKAQESPAILPPPKRQRKPKDPNAPTPVKKTAKSDVTKSTSISTTNSQPFSPATSQSTPISVEATIPPRHTPQGLEAHYERFASLQQQQQLQQAHVQQSQQQLDTRQQHDRQQQARIDQTSATRSSPQQASSSSMQSSPLFSFQSQQPRHVTSYSQQYPSHQPSNPYQQSPLSSQADSFRSVNQTQTHYSPSPRQSQQQQTSHQNQNSHHNSFSHNHSHFSDSSSLGGSFIDPLESVTNGHAAPGVSNSYSIGSGAGISRSANNPSYGTGVAAQMGGFEGLSDNDIRDRLLRGIGRR